MPVEIRELNITTTVSDTSSQPNSTSSATMNTDSIIAQCVEQVLLILQQKNER